MKKILPAMICLYLLVYILPMGGSSAFIPDETRYGEIPREMIATGDYVVPKIDGLRYFEKPVMGYWLNAASIKMFGENSFAIRFPAAVAAGLTAILAYGVGTMAAGGATVGFLSAAILLTLIEAFVIGQFGVLDGMFSCFLTASLVAFLYADTADRGSKKRLLFLVLFGAMAGLAFLAKGFLAFVLPIIIIVPFLVWEKRAKELLTIPWLPILVAVLVALPWAIAIQVRDPDFWHFFIVHEHIKRFLGDAAQHRQPFWYFILLLPAAALPWTFLFPAALSGLKKRGINGRAIRYVICWFVFPFLFFSASKGKLATYILPCFPPLAVLFAIGLETYCRQKDRPLLSGGAYAAVVVTLIVFIALAVMQWTDLFHFRPYAQSGKAVLIGCALLVWTGFSFAAARSGNGLRQVTLFCIAPLAFMFMIHFAIPDRVLSEKAPRAFLLKQAEKIKPQTAVVAEAYLVTSACWYYKRDNVYVMGIPGELSYGLSYPDSKYRHLDTGSFRQLVEKQHEKNERVVFVAEQKRYDQWVKDLPPPRYVESNGFDVFAEY